MKPYFDDGDGCVLHLGDSLDVLPTLADESIDAVICDPPYGLAELSTATVLQAIAAWMAGDRTHVPDGKGFMSKSWDSFVPPPGVWDECHRVLKPGGHLLCFAAPRTYDLMGLSIRIAGFEIRDEISSIGPALVWAYGQGMPKGQDIGKAIDRHRDDREGVLRVTAWLRDARDTGGWTTARIDALFGFNGMASHWCAIAGKAAVVPTLEQWAVLRDALGFDDAEVLPLVEELNGRKGEIGEDFARREVVGQGFRVRRESPVQIAGLSAGEYPITTPATDEAKSWTGWNTQLKPAHEPIIVARKRTGFNATVANVLEHGTGALNVDACRTRAGSEYRDKCASVVGIDSPRNGDTLGEWTGIREDSAHDLGRWPTNLLLTHSPECEQVGARALRGDSRSGQERGSRPGGFADVGADSGDQRPNGPLHGPEVVPVFRCTPGCPVAEMDRQSGVTTSAASRRGERRGAVYNGPTGPNTIRGHDDEGGASRFYPVFKFEPKAAASERPRLADGTAWPTVKPVDLMRWLVRLVTPPGGVILDPFCGTGATGEAAIVEGFRCVLIDRDPVAAELAKLRLSKPIQPSLFGLGGAA